MQQKKIQVLRMVKDGPFSIKELAASLGLSYSRAAAITRELVREGYCERAGKKITLAGGVKGELLKEVSKKYNLAAILGGQNKWLVLALSKPLTADEIQTKTGLAQSTVYQALRSLMVVGAVQKIGRTYTVADDRELGAFLDLLRRERRARGVEPHATVVYSNKDKLKKVAAGRPARGAITAFSMFSKFGVDYISPNDYYIDPPKEILIEDVLIHALVCSETKTDATMCAVFYLKNLPRIDPARAKKLANEFGVMPLWLDLQNYARGQPVANVEKFLPWNEFVGKAGLYEVKVSLPPPAEQSVALLREIGNKLSSVTHAYLFGGGNLLHLGLKKATKDIDVVVEDEESFSRLREALAVMGFRELSRGEMIPSDKKLNPSGIFVAEGLLRVDIFTRVICNAFALTENMKRRARAMAFGKLVMHLLSLEDVFLLKSITEREGDLEDMAAIVERGGALDWNMVMETYVEEEQIAKTHFCFIMLDNVEILQRREGIALPFYKSLEKHCLDMGILLALSYGAKTITEIQKYVDFPESRIRNRVHKLVKDGKISRRGLGKRITLILTAKGKASIFL